MYFFQTVTTMGKKDAMHQMNQVDQYRHQIGRQESKKLLKRETSRRKRKESERVQKTGAVGYMGKLLLILFLILAALYLVAYMIAQRDGNKLGQVFDTPYLRPIAEYLEKLYQVWVKPYSPF